MAYLLTICSGTPSERFYIASLEVGVKFFLVSSENDSVLILGSIKTIKSKLILLIIIVHVSG